MRPQQNMQNKSNLALHLQSDLFVNGVIISLSSLGGEDIRICLILPYLDSKS